MKKKELLYSGILLLVSLLWGFSFAFQSMGMDYVGPMAFNMVRSLLACLFLAPLVWYSLSGSPLTREEVMGGLLCGLLIGVGNTLQQIGLQYTSVGKAGFITALYVIMVPVLGILLGRKINAVIWIWVLMAVAGMYFLCLPEGNFIIQKGDWFVLGTAVTYAFQILVVDHYSDRGRGIVLNFVQSIVCFVMSLVLMLALEEFNFGLLWQARWAVFYAGVVSCGIGYTLQFVAQKEVNPTAASLIMCFEAVFSAIGGWLLLNQRLNQREIMGCVLIFAAMIMCQLTMNLKRKG